MTALCVLPHRDQPAEPEPPALICGWHRRGLDRLLCTIREDWLNLALIVEAGSAPKDSTPKTRHMKTSSPPAPVNLDVIVLRDPRTHAAPLTALQRDGKPSDPSRPAQNVLAVVASWVLLVAEERPITVKLPSSVIAQLDLLERHTDWISRQDWVDEFWNELGQLRRALRGALHDSAATFLGRCYLPVDGGDGPCGGNLLRPNGSHHVQCHRCGAKWTTAYQLATLQLALGRSA